jgi:hypothetical protein
VPESRGGVIAAGMAAMLSSPNGVLLRSVVSKAGKVTGDSGRAGVGGRSIVAAKSASSGGECSTDAPSSGTESNGGRERVR